ncbi:MAG: hypothetical protein KF691_15365 [Phycisphaeraceae bacterium]|nr:hypothetical protein [Phycisphaeraceae bacterium]
MSRSIALAIAVMALAVLAPGCATNSARSPDLKAIYEESAQKIGSERNPVVVIPGILGSNLVEKGSGKVVWGAFTYGATDTDYPEGARLFCLPMRSGASLSELTDDVEPDGVLESLEANVGLLKVNALEPYKGIIRSLAAGKYVDRDIARASRAKTEAEGPIDYAGLHYTCFQFDYDWRRDISESAARLDRLVRDAAGLATDARADGRPAKVDVVAHSMGGLVALYYLRYGTQALPEDGSLPQPSWEGAKFIDQLIIVGTPSAGSVLALKQMVEGVSYSPITPTYQPAFLGTMPSIYELLPRTRHARVIDSQTRKAIDLYDVETWKKYNWGLADARQDRYVAWLLPDVGDAEQRRAIALDQLSKCLKRAKQLHAALDRPIGESPVPIHLIAGDTIPTPSVITVDHRSGQLTVSEQAPGDGTVTRASALMDERTGGGWKARLDSPIAWSSVRFLQGDHIELTSNAPFTDDLLYLLLEAPRRHSATVALRAPD